MQIHKKSPAQNAGPFSIRLPNYSYIGCLRTLFALGNLILNTLSFFQSLKAFHVQAGEMYKNILSILK